MYSANKINVDILSCAYNISKYVVYVYIDLCGMRYVDSYDVSIDLCGMRYVNSYDVSIKLIHSLGLTEIATKTSASCYKRAHLVINERILL